MSTTTNPPSNEQKVIEALAGAPAATVDEVAAATGIGRTSARRYLSGLEHTGKVKHTAGGREGKRKLPDRYSLIADEKRPPKTKSGTTNPKGSEKRLRPGGLDGLVLGYMRDHQEDGPLSPSLVAKGLGRSAGAVLNCLERLAAAGKVSKVSGRPRRYNLKEGE